MMKKIFAALAAFCCIALTAAPPEGWGTDYDAALEQAAQEGKTVLVLFTGSDWCSWCIKLRRETLEKKAFQNFASENLVLVYMDMPRKQPAAEKAKVQALAAKLQAGGGVPCTVLVGPDGEIKGKISGYRPLKKYLDEIRKILQ